MEEKLAEYRAQKSKEYQARKTSNGDNVIQKGWQFLNSWRKEPNNGKTDSGQPVIRDSTENQKEQTEPLIFNSSGTVGDGYNTDNPQNVLFNPTVYKCVLWFILWGLFIELGFGAVYFILSISVILYKNMRSGSRESSELSAYSVFNPNCERIDGTFTAEQFEKELRFGAGSVH